MKLIVSPPRVYLGLLFDDQDENGQTLLSHQMMLPPAPLCLNVMALCPPGPAED